MSVHLCTFPVLESFPATLLSPLSVAQSLSLAFRCWDLHGYLGFPSNDSLNLDSRDYAPLLRGADIAKNHYIVKCHWMSSLIYPDATAKLNSNDLIFPPECFCPWASRWQGLCLLLILFCFVFLSKLFFKNLLCKLLLLF